MSPSAINDYSINLTLQYVVPPANPLPEHIISRALHQRHHFLSIDVADDPQAYFCWPQSKQDAPRVIAALDALGGQEVERLAGERAYDIDGEETRARVQVGQEVQVVFIWEEDGWKYHDAQPLPFPPNSHPTLDAALSSRLRPSHAEVSKDRSGANTPGSDGYWNGYGTTPPSPRSDFLRPPNDAADGDDSYWAQYSTVQGSGDSTIPSPVNPKRKLAPFGASNGDGDHYRESHDIVNAMHPTGPMHPEEALASYLQPELETATSEPQGLALNLNSPQPFIPPITAPRPNLHMAASLPVLDWVDVPSDESSSPVSVPYSQVPDANRTVVDPTAEALRGIYRMWRRERGQVEPRGKEKEEFMSLVQTAIADL